MKVKRFVAVTGCAAGIAHTYMAQEALEKRQRNWAWKRKWKSERTIGTENKLTEEEIDKADVVIIAADIQIDKSRFIGKGRWKWIRTRR